MKKVLLGMSGGTDSSVAAFLLQEAGYEVTGITFRFYEGNDDTTYIDDARDLAKQLGIRHLIYDAREQFRSTVVEYFVQEYMAGHTPVPCTLCNQLLKWPLLREVADRENIPFLATGHYVRRRQVNNLHYIVSGIDPDKDQSFFLWGLSQDIIARMVLPMGELTKTEVRRMAAERGFHKAAVKKDSTGVCFCPTDYRDFLCSHLPTGRIQPGFFIDERGEILGKHKGYAFYTIGQRRGLGIHLNRPVFVKEIDPIANRVVLAPFSSLERRQMKLKDWNLVNPAEVLADKPVEVKIRYRKQLNHAYVTLTPDRFLQVDLCEPLTAVAAGQAAAFYQDDRVLGGGLIV